MDATDTKELSDGALTGGEQTIEAMAARDPVYALAYALGIPKVPYAWALQGIFNDTTDFNTIVQALQQAPLAQRTWVRKVKFSLWLPNYFPNQVLSTLAAAQLRAETGILAQVWSYDAPKYVIASFSPLETLFGGQDGSDDWVRGWRLERQGALKADLQLQQGPGGTTTNVGPMTVNLQFLGSQFLDPYIDEVSPYEARCVLEKSGFRTGTHVQECAKAVRKNIGVGRLEMPDFDYLKDSKKARPPRSQ